MRTKIWMKRDGCVAVNRENEIERKSRHKSVEKDKLTSSRHEGETMERRGCAA